MDWYEKLTHYFPENEMKPKEQIESLLQHNPHYKKAETDEYILLYGEYDHFIFLDYLLVEAKTRGKGIGKNILEKLKAKQKNVILEVEPVCAQEPDTLKRERFYIKNGFIKAQKIHYQRDIGEESPELNTMDIYYWPSSEDMNEETIHQQLLQAYADIHHHQFEQYFDREEPELEELVQLEDPSYSADNTTQP